MQVFNTFFKVAKKYMGVCSIYLVVFVTLLVIMSKFTGPSETKQYQGAKCNLVVFDRDNSNESKKLVKYLESKNNIIELKDDRNEILDNLYYQKIDYVLYIEESFGTTGKLSNIKRPNSNSGTYMDGAISSYLNSVSSLVSAGYSLDEAYDITIDALDAANLVSVVKKGSDKNQLYYFYQYLPYVITMMLLSALAPILVIFNKRENLDRTNIAPIKTRSRSLQVIAGSVVFGVAIWAFFVILSVIAYGGDLLKGKMPLYIVNSLIFVLIIIGLVNVIGNFNLKKENISMISNIVGLGMSFLGGIFVPLEIFSDKLLKVSKFMPTYWYVMAENNILSDAPMNEILKCFGVMVLFAVVFVVLAMVVAQKLRMSRAE